MAKNHFEWFLQNLHMEALAAVSRCLRRFYFLKTGAIFYIKALAAVSRCLRRFYFFKTGTYFHMETWYFHIEALAAVSRCLRRFYFLKTGTFFTQTLAALYRLPPAG